MKKLLVGLLAVLLIGVISIAVVINATGDFKFNTVGSHEKKVDKNIEIKKIESSFISYTVDLHEKK
ncbi:hypothetical protein [Cytobacillus sp. IB215316]|uniref:hypothetical protein n=1 Tax=Cytobacillus sp. IB215316 TaxID=3097354 RepID=UPI002A0CA9BC|nr:hypothetical protein [Cytobacillus sp. IB215316]MDX8363454.1 hypothetical protein [Cytobacillus sp. IB215316]